jgi:hypothetical protein
LEYITEEQYKQLCRACDGLLSVESSNYVRQAIRWLHLVRPHPTFLKNYVDIFRENPKKIVWTWIRNSLAVFCVLRKTIGKHKKSNLPQGPLGSCDILFISHLINKSTLTSKEDFYFGSSPFDLSRIGYKVLIGLINHTEADLKISGSCCGKKEVPYIIFEKALSFQEEWLLFWKVLREGLRIQFQKKAHQSSFDSRVAARAAAEAISTGTIFNLRVREQIKALVAQTRPRAVITTYEGHPWERFVFYAAREVLPAVRCIAYQHSAIFKLQHAYQRSLAPSFNPDFIFTAGTASAAIFREDQKFKDKHISVFGSPRHSLRHSVPRRSLNPEKKKICLVLPEGIPSECLMLFKFSLECLHVMPEIRFIWRLHPSVNYTELTREIPNLNDLPVRITLSNKTLDADIQQSHWALYRGSTAIVQAAIAGISPIYLSRPREITIDPLHAISSIRLQVSTPEDFKDLVSRPDAGNHSIQEVQNYCEKLFTPLDISCLINAISLGQYQEEDS